MGLRYAEVTRPRARRGMGIRPIAPVDRGGREPRRDRRQHRGGDGIEPLGPDEQGGEQHRGEEEACRRRVPAAVPTAIASVGETSNQTTGSVASPMPRKTGGEDGPAAEAAREAHPVGDRLGEDQDKNDPGGALRDQVRDRGLAGEEHVLRVSTKAVREQRDEPDGEAAREQERGHAEPAVALAGQARREPVDDDDHHRCRDPHADRHQQVEQVCPASGRLGTTGPGASSPPQSPNPTNMR